MIDGKKKNRSSKPEVCYTSYQNHSRDFRVFTFNMKIFWGKIIYDNNPKDLKSY